MTEDVKRSMSDSRGSYLRVSPLAWVLTLGACSTVIGIEDLNNGPRPGTGSGGDGSIDGSAGSSSKSGNKNGGASNGGASQVGGGGDAAVGNEPGAGSGSLPTAGTAGSAGEGGAGGTGQADDGAVRGHVVDFWGHKLANVPVQIGTTLVSTDEDGAFTIEDVGPTYDVSLSFELDPDRFKNYYGWVFQGLTRRDPTLQVIRGLSTRDGNFVLTPDNVDPTANQKILFAFGGKDGSYTHEVAKNGIDTSADWVGGDSTNFTVHGLFFQYDADEIPTSYLSYNSTLTALSEGSKQNITLDLEPGANPLDSGNLSGTVTPGPGSDRRNQVFLHFTSGAAIELLDESPGPNSFAYNVPSIPNSSITVVASEGDSYYGPYALAHADGLSATSKPALKIPSPVTLTLPAANATNVDMATQFSFQSPASNAGPFVVKFSNADQNGRYQYLWVVTAAKQLTIPEVTGGAFKLLGGQVHTWNVATYGKFASVDAMAGPDGFLDPIGVEEAPVGPTNADGEYTVSAARAFTLAP